MITRGSAQDFILRKMGVVIRALIALAIMLGAVAVTASPATAAVTKTAAPVRACTNLNDSSCKVIVKTFASGSPVTMRCWEDGPVAYAGTVRFFWVKGPGGVEGYVSANHTGQQAAVGHCNNVPYVKAARWAGSKLSESVYANYCLRFVRDAWLQGGRDIGSAYDAISYWRANPRGYGKGSTANPPAGYLVFWAPDAYNPHGHVALSIGGGLAISTYERSTQPVHVMSIADRNRTKPYLGWMAVS